MDKKVEVQPKRLKTKHTGVFYKNIVETTINDAGKISTKQIDKVYLIMYKSKGKLKYITLGKYSEGIREAYCKAKRDEFVLVERNGELPPQIQKRTKKNIVTLDKMADFYFDDDERKDNFDELTRSAKKQKGRYILHIQPKFGNKDISNISKQDFKDLQKRLSRTKAAKTVNGITALARAIINFYIKEKELQLVNPAADITPVELTADEGTRDRFLSIDEIDQLFKAVSGDDELYHFTKMALMTGARLESVLAIRKRDIDTKHNTIKLQDFKNNKTYTGFFDDEKYKEEVANRLSKLKDADCLIDTPSRTIQRKLKPILDRLFNEGRGSRDAQNRVVIHSLRHTFASHLAINGVPIFTIKELMNHGTIEMTMRYAKLSSATGAAAVKGMYNV